MRTHQSVLAALVLAALAVLAMGAPAGARDAGDDAPAQVGDTITWMTDVTKAFEKAAKEKRPVMICINSRLVDGGGKPEPAAQGLREVVYLDPRVVGKSRAFVCVMLTSEGSSNDYGELRLRFGISGFITSPQHIFAHPEHAPGSEPLLRREYWPFGKGEDAVKALTGMMDRALTAYRAQAGLPAAPTTPAPQGPDAQPPAAPDAPPAAPDAVDERAAWIAKLLEIVENGDEGMRRSALRSLVTNDKEGDCTDALIALMPRLEKAKVAALTDVVRALGRPKLEAAAEPIAGYLKHKDDALRANAAVSLEYIGSPTSVGDLLARAGREKDEYIANHIYRALGRCGVGDGKVRALLAKKSEAAKNEEASFGPIVGLAYFEKDKKAARAVEKLLQKMGPPGGGRRGGGRNTMRRTLLAWTLSEIQDPKSAAFVREKLLKALENTQGWWVGAVTTYYEAIARVCEGDKAAADGIDAGIRRTLEFTGGTQKFQDAARKDRDTSTFTPKAEWDVEGRENPFGGRSGGGAGR